jgi:hypothetical protein
MNNGFSTGEEDERPINDQKCCLVDDNIRCQNHAGNASYSKRIQKTVTQRRLKLNIDALVGNLSTIHFYIRDNTFYYFFYHRLVIFTFVIYTNLASRMHGQKGERILRMTAMRLTLICPKLICISCRSTR